MVRMRCFQRARLPAGFLTSPSPASLQSNRLAVHVFDKTCHVYFASGTHTYQAKLLMEDEVVVRGKENLLIPTDVQMLEINPINSSPHRAEIQCISISEPTYDGSVLIGTADSRGRITVSCLGMVEKGAAYTACPQDAGLGEGGWAGLTFVPGQPFLVAVARGLAKSIDFYDKDLHVRTLHTLYHPTALTFLEGPTHGHSTSSVLAITEGPQISVWDLRASENGGCVQRLFGSSSLDPLYAVCSSSNGFLGTGGAERCAVVFDTKKWTAISRWTGCLKYEVVCGRWNARRGTDRQCFFFRGDSRWLGFRKCPYSDIFAGWCESGSIFAGEAVS